MEENQNTNEHLQPEGVIRAEAKERSETITPETSASFPAKAKEQTTTLAIQPETTDHQPQTDSMEVHKHPHHVMHKKKWNEYLLEFFMIFFAVFLGFIAETIREHSSENSRAKDFALSMINDLEEDTAQLRSYNKYFTSASDNVDTLMQLLSANNPENIPSGKLYWFGLWGGAHRDFVPNDATFEQMKSSGSLRFFKKTVANNVANYNRFCRLILENDEKEQGIYVEVRKSRAQIFDFRYNDIANDIAQEGKIADNHSRIDSFMKTNPPLLSVDKTLFNQYIELVRSRFLRSRITLSDSLLNSATVLIKELKNTYNLENE